MKAGWRAFESWKNVSPAERSGLLLKIADLIDANAEKLAMVETLCNGEPIRETMGTPAGASDQFRYFAGCLRADEGSAVMIDKNTLSIILKEPLGVVGQIVPWNVPLSMAAWELALALAPATSCWSMKASGNLRSPAPRRLVIRSPKPRPRRSSLLPWNWAVNPRTSSSRTRRGSKRSKAHKWVFCSTRARFAALGRGPYLIFILKFLK